MHVIYCSFRGYFEQFTSNRAEITQKYKYKRNDHCILLTNCFLKFCEYILSCLQVKEPTYYVTDGWKDRQQIERWTDTQGI